MSKKKDLIRYTLRNEQQLENCIRAIADEFIKRQGDKTAKPLQIIGNPERKKRTTPQSDLQFVWYTIAEQQGDMTASEYRALCKLNFGVPILCRDDDEYRQEFNENVGCFDDEVQLSILKSKVIKYPVTSIMNDAQMSEYLSLVKNYLVFDCGIDIDGVLRYEQA